MELFEDFLGQTLRIWRGGGWAMWPIAVIAFVMCAMGIHIALGLLSKFFSRVPEDEWRGWIHRPSERTGMIGDFLHYVCGTGSGRSVKEVTHAFHGLRQSEILPFERDLKVMKVCVSAAPLVGLLGTVTGMLSTFGALSSGAGGDQTMSMIAEGISEALITTMTGLVISLPGLFFQYFLTRGFERYKVFLAHFESVCVQSLFTESEVEKRIAARRLAKARIAKALRKRLAERGVDPQLRRALHAGATSPELTPLQSVEA